MTIPPRVYIAGEAAGPALVLDAPLSFWGGVDAATGKIIDRTHPQTGACVAGMILVLPGARGSSSSSSVLAECIRVGTAPAGIILASADPILVVGALVAQSLYGTTCPIVVCAIEGIRSGAYVTIRRSEVSVDKQA
jgi:predicted aconitase with swiveling domain